MAQAELVDQAPVRAGLLDCIEIGALEVLDQCPRQLRAVVCGPHQRGNAFQAGHLGRAQASFAGNQAVAPGHLCDEDRLKHAVLGDARRELVELRLIECLTRLIRVTADSRDGQLDGRRLLVALRNERRQSSAQAAARTLHVCGHAPIACAARVVPPPGALARSRTSSASAR